MIDADRVRAVLLAVMMVSSVAVGSVALSAPATASDHVEVGDGVAEPSQVSPGTTENNQQVHVVFHNVSGDGDEDTYYATFPNDLAENLSVNQAEVNISAGISSSATLVDGPDNDGVDDTVTFGTQSDASGDLDVNATVDVAIDPYPSTEASYDIDATINDSSHGSDSRDGVATIVAGTPPSITDYQVTNPSGKQINVSFNSSEQLTNITADVSDTSGTTVTTLTETDFTETDQGSVWHYNATYTASQDDDYTVTLTEATDSAGIDGSSGESGTVSITTATVSILGGTAEPSQVAAGNTVNNQKVYVDVANVSADGDTDWFYVEFPDALASGLSPNYANANDTSIESSVQLVDGYDGDGVDDTLKFATSADGGGTIPLNVSVDTGVDYPDTQTTYDIDFRVEDSDGDAANQSGVATITAGSSPTITNYSVTNPADREINVSFDSTEQLATITVDVTDSDGNTVATLTESDFVESSQGSNWTYAATYTASHGGSFTATLVEAKNTSGIDGARDQSGTVSLPVHSLSIVGGSAEPAQVSAGNTVNNQKVYVNIANVSADGDTDTFYIEFPNELASGLSPNYANANDTSITSSIQLVDGYDGDGVDDTLRFSTSATGGGPIPLNVSVDTGVDYPDTDATYGIDVRVDDSCPCHGALTRSDVVTIQAGSGSSGGGGGDHDGGGSDDWYDRDDFMDDETGSTEGSSDSMATVDLTADGSDVDVTITSDTRLDAFTADVSGPVETELTRDDFTHRQAADGTHVYTADVASGEAGEYVVALGQTTEDTSASMAIADRLSVEPLRTDAAADAAAGSILAGADSSTHTFTAPVGEESDLTGETLDGVVIGYSDAFQSAGGSVTSVSDDQNVDTLQVVSADGTVKSSLGGSDAVSVNVDDGAVQLDLSDVDSARKPTLERGDRVIVRLQPVTNPDTAGSYETDVTLHTAAGTTGGVTTTVAIRDPSTVAAIGTAFVQPDDESTTVELAGSDAIDSVTIDSSESATGSVRVTVPEGSAAVADAPGTVVSALNVSRPDPVEDSSAAIRVTLSTAAVDASAEHLTMMRYDASEGEWHPLGTTVVSQSDDTVTVEATTPETSLFAVAAVEDTEATATATATDTATPTDGGAPGFGLLTALVALLGAALLGVRRRID